MISMDMPILQPIPIKTKGLPWPKATWVWLTKPRLWRVVEDWEFVLPDKVKIMIPQGFEFDGASMPRAIWWLLSPTGLLLIPGIIHDYSYAKGFLLADGEDFFNMGRGRAHWDRLFRDIAIEVNGFKILNYGAWIFLVVFGWIAWNKHRRNSLSGI